MMNTLISFHEFWVIWINISYECIIVFLVPILWLNMFVLLISVGGWFGFFQEGYINRRDYWQLKVFIRLLGS